jgi:hypothetical protein
VCLPPLIADFLSPCQIYTVCMCVAHLRGRDATPVAYMEIHCGYQYSIYEVSQWITLCRAGGGGVPRPALVHAQVLRLQVHPSPYDTPCVLVHMTYLTGKSVFVCVACRRAWHRRSNHAGAGSPHRRASERASVCQLCYVIYAQPSSLQDRAYRMYSIYTVCVW